MVIKLSAAVKNAMLDTLESTIGTAPILEIRSGAAPTNETDPDSGTLLASMTLPSDWLAAASNGQKVLLGTWQDLSADGTGTAGHFRLKNSAGSVCHMQGSLSLSGGGGDLFIDNTSIVTGQQINVSSLTLSL